MVIQSADKSSTVVITEKNGYMMKLLKLKESISDTSKFEQISSNNLNFFKKWEKNFNLMKRLENDGKISENEYVLISPWGSRPGIFYGSPKVHKPVVPNKCPNFRPILSAIRAPTHQLVKLLVPNLSVLTIKWLFSFKNEVSRFCLDYFMVSLDVESLFTNITLNSVIDICIDDLFSDTNTIHSLDRHDMR